jgi:hypothetical protein
LNKEVTVRFGKLKNAAVGFDVLTTCQPSTVWCSRKRLPAAAAQPAKVVRACSATDWIGLLVNSLAIIVCVLECSFLVIISKPSI